MTSHSQWPSGDSAAAFGSDSSTRVISGRRGVRDPRRQIGLNVGQLLSGELVNKVLRFVAFVVLARSLSASDFGLLNVGIAISGTVLVASSLGLPDLAARDVAVAPGHAGWLAGHVAVARVIVLGAFSVIGILLATLVWPGHTSLLIMAALMAVFMAVSSDWLARGLERMSVAAAANASGGLAIVAGSLAVAKLSGSATTALAAFAIAECVVAVVLWTNLHLLASVQLGVRGMGSMVRRAWPLAFSSLAIYSYYANVDTIILAASHSNREAGLYSAPYRLFLVLNLVGVFAAYAMLPTLARLADTRVQANADGLIRSTLSPLAGYGLFTLGLVELGGADALGALFGTPFRAASGAFVLLTAGVAWYAVGYPTGYSLIARGENARFLRGAASASILSIGLDIALIPPLGMSGAGLATMSAFAAAALVWLWERRLLGRAAIPTLLSLSATSLLAVYVVFSDGSGQIAGAATLCVASVLVLRGAPIRLLQPWTAALRRRGAK
jgi:O-antigen/teichoic acid export membrane protein